MRNIPFGCPMIGEEEKAAVMEVLSQPVLVHGPQGKRFEELFARFTGEGRALSLSSCTAGLHLAYFHHGLKPGDEVIVPAQTHVATAHAVELTGASVVFVDVEADTGNIDVAAMEAAITPNTRAIGLVHYLGCPADMDGVMDVAQRHDLLVIEDCALAVGSTYKGTHVGLIGDAGCFSFYPVKHMTTAEGGMLITKHDAMADGITLQRAFHVDRTHSERALPGQYDVTGLGFNYRMSELQAAIGIEQMHKLDSFLARRKENFEVLSSAIGEAEGVSIIDGASDDNDFAPYCLSVVFDDDLAQKRFEIIGKLKEKGVGTSIYYPKPVPHMKYYAEKYGHQADSFPNAARISYQSLAMPVGPHLDTNDMNYIANTFLQAIQEV